MSDQEEPTVGELAERVIKEKVVHIPGWRVEYIGTIKADLSDPKMGWEWVDKP